MSYAKDEFKSFFDEGGFGTKALYRCETKIVTKNVISSLIPYITDGEINIDKIKSSEEIIAIQQENTFSAGQAFTLASVLNGGETMIGEISTASVTVGATVVLPDSLDKLLSYILKNDNSYYFLTTAGGANALNLHNAAYTEIFAEKPISSDLIPPSAGMTKVSLAELKNEQFVKKAAEYGGMTLLIVLMALLGFSAYFNGIIMKIRLKSYQISVLRAMGADLKPIRRRLYVDNLKIPLISGVIAYLLSKLTQAISFAGYQKLLAFYDEIIAQNGGLVYTMAEDMVIKKLKIDYFIEQLFWAVPLEAPLAILLGLMCCLTLLLTISALKKLSKTDLARMLSLKPD